MTTTTITATTAYKVKAPMGREGLTPLLPRFFLLAVVFLLALPSAVSPQPVTSYPVFRAYREGTKSAAAEVFVLQLPQKSAKRAELHSLTLYCTADIDVTIEVNGGGSTSSVFSTSSLNQQGVSAIARAYHTSNSTAGTAINKFTLFGDSTLTLNLVNTILPSGQADVKNFIVRTSAFTGTIRYSLTWAER